MCCFEKHVGWDPLFKSGRDSRPASHVPAPTASDPNAYRDLTILGATQLGVGLEDCEAQDGIRRPDVTRKVKMSTSSTRGKNARFLTWNKLTSTSSTRTWQ